MSSETLRRAAALMRERANDTALESPWRVDPDEPQQWFAPDHGGERVVGECYEEGDALHVASWHPAVALAVADWLESTADRIDAGREPSRGGRRNHSWRGSREALAVARAYLGGSA